MLSNDELNIFPTDSTVSGLVNNNANEFNFQVPLLSSGDTFTVLPPDDEILITASQLDELEVNNIDGTPGRDNLVGTEGDDLIISSQGRDTITGGDGNDTFVYTNVRHRSDIITDFELGKDKIDFTEVLNSIGITEDDPIASGHVGLQTNDTDVIITIDPDGAGRRRAVPFVTLQDLADDVVDNESFLADVLGLSSDVSVPIVSAELLNDTGDSDTDNITSDPTIIGTINTESEVVSLTAGFNETSVEDFVDVTAALLDDGTFELDQELLEDVLGETLTNGTYTLKLQATDNDGNLSEVIELEFTLDLDVEVPIISAELANDTGEDDTDNITSDPTIIGTINTESEVVSLTAGFNETSVEDFVDVTTGLLEDGSFELDQELLEDVLGETLTNGTYTLKLQATDNDGNLSEVIELEFTLDLDVEAPMISVELANDTGVDDTDEITSDPTIIGIVTDANEVVSLKAGFNDTPTEDFVEIIDLVDADGNFNLDEAQLEEILGDNFSDGFYNLNLMAIDAAGNSSTAETTFILDTGTPGFELGELTVMPGDRLEIPLAATSPNGLEFAIESDGPLPQGQLTGDGTLIFTPTPEEIGSYEFTLITRDGATETTQTVTLTIPEDTTTTTRISGVIENISEEPLSGVVIELGDLETTTAADGSFTIEVEGELPDDTLKIRGETIEGDLTYPFIPEKLSLLLERDPYLGYNNVIWRPIYLPPIDTSNAVTINPTANTLVTTEAIPGASVLVPANSLQDQDGNPYTGELSITAVPNELTPAALPTNLVPDLVVTIQPGEMVFNTPAALSLPNTAGYEPGTEMDLWSINPNTGLFDNVGVGRVSNDGTVVETISGGIINSSWHFFTPPPPTPKDLEDNPRNPDERCNECKETENFTSVVELHSGAVVETHNLVPYQSLGVARGLRLTYDSLRADARPILHFGYENTQANPDRRLVANLTVSRDGFEYQVPGVQEGEYGLRAGDNLWSIPEAGGEIDAALQVDLRALPSGQYDYELDSGLRLFNGERFVGSSTTSEGKFLHVNSIESPFGSGWGLAGLQELVENPDGSVLLVDGDGSELLFELDGEGNFVSPPGDFSVLEQVDGQFQRTMKDKTVYDFDGENRLVGMTEANGDETEYVYDAEGRLEKIVDPAGLETSFTYVDGRVSSISDPAGRTTELVYDADGNLERIIDPDESERQFDYDGEHRLVEEIDKRGEVERAEYDFAGRASSATRKDGSQLEVAPVQVQGLYLPSETVKPFDAPEAFALGDAVATTTDANGNVTEKELDRAGQVVSAEDSVGLLPAVERDENNLVQTRTNGRGNVTEYSYDEMGNVVEIEDELSPPGGVFFDISETGTLVPGLQNTRSGLTTEVDFPFSFMFDGVEQTRIEIYTRGFVRLRSPSRLSATFSPFTMRLNTLSDEGGAAEILFETRGEEGSRQFIIQWHEVEADRYDRETGDITFQVVLFEGTNEILFNYLDVHFEGRTDDLYGQGDSTSVGIYNHVTRERVNFSSGTRSLRDGMSLRVTPEEITEVVNTGPVPGPRRFTYDPNFNLLASETDELGRKILYDRDPITGNLLSVTRVVGEVGGDDDAVTTYTYTDRNLIDTETDPLGRTTDYDYDPVSGQVSKITFAQGTADEAVQEFEYDLAGNQTAFIDENGNRTEYKYDEMGRLVETIYAVGTADEAVEKSEYDEAGLEVATVDANGNRTEYDYDEMGRLIEVVGTDPDGDGPEESPITTYEYDDEGNQEAMVDPLGRRTEYVYDERNRLVEMIYPDGSTERMGYDVDNNPISTTDAEGNKSDRLFDARGRMISQTDPLGNTTTLEYDGANQLIAQVDANNKRTEFEYDELGRQTTVTDEAGTTVTEYDLVGNVAAVIDPLDQRTEYEYDERSRQIQVKDAEGGIVTTEYDSAGNVIELTDSEGNLTTFVYDGRQRLQAETNELGKTRSYEYDGTGNLIATVDRNDRRREFVYDGLNRQSAENWVDEEDNIIHQITYNYDAVDQLTQVTDPDSTFSYTYDQLGRMLTVDNAGTPGMPNVVLSYDYDSDGNLISVSETIDGVAGGVTAYNYDESDRLDSITQTGNGVSDKRVDFDYDNIGQFSSIRRYSDLDGSQLVTESNYSYDELNRIDSLTHSNGGSNLAFYEFEFDAAGRIRQITDIDGTTDYSYDSTNQLTAADRSNPNNPDESYDYDANGNRISSHLHDSDYVTGDNNRLESDGVYNYQYDDEGNLIQRIEIATGAVRTFEWDYRNRLVEIVDRDAVGENVLEVEFAYDAMDRRFRQVVDSTPLDDVEGDTTYFVSDRNNVLLEFEGESEPIRYLHGPQVDQILAREDADGETMWHLTDHLGTVRDLVDNDGEVLNHLSYDSFGRVVSQTDETVSSRYRFTGREFDEETGLHYYRARYYDSDVGRFISSDPIGFESGDVNLYRYVGNSPVNRVDPSGLASMELTALLYLAKLPSDDRVYNGLEFSSYNEALASAMGWFSVITIESSRKTRTIASAKVPWLVTGHLKDDTGLLQPSRAGLGILRPNGSSGPNPTIQLDEDDLYREHNTPGRKGAKKVKFHYPGDDDPNHPIAKVCPSLPKKEKKKKMDEIYDDIIDHHAPTLAPSPAPTNPWQLPKIPPIPFPRRNPFRLPQH